MIVAIHQPQYLPWLGYLDKLDRADCFVWLDNAQFEKHDWQNRNRVRTATGWQWLTVPVHQEFPVEIRQVRIDNRSAWREVHWKTLVANYHRAPHFRTYQALFEDVYRRPWDRLAALAMHGTTLIRTILGITTPCRLASELVEGLQGTERVIALCRAVGADTYLSGTGGRSYLDEAAFARAGIRLVYQDYRHPCYQQVFATRAPAAGCGPGGRGLARGGSGFIPQLSVVDLLFNEGPRSVEILRSTRGQEAEGGGPGDAVVPRPPSPAHCPPGGAAA